MKKTLSLVIILAFTQAAFSENKSSKLSFKERCIAIFKEEAGFGTIIAKTKADFGTLIAETKADFKALIAAETKGGFGAITAETKARFGAITAETKAGLRAITAETKVKTGLTELEESIEQAAAVDAEAIVKVRAKAIGANAEAPKRILANVKTKHIIETGATAKLAESIVGTGAKTQKELALKVKLAVKIREVIEAKIRYDRAELQEFHAKQELEIAEANEREAQGEPELEPLEEIDGVEVERNENVELYENLVKENERKALDAEAELEEAATAMKDTTAALATALVR